MGWVRPERLIVWGEQDLHPGKLTAFTPGSGQASADLRRSPLGRVAARGWAGPARDHLEL